MHKHQSLNISQHSFAHANNYTQIMAFNPILNLTQAFAWLTQPRMSLNLGNQALTATQLLMATLLIDMAFAGQTSDIACHIGGFLFGYFYVTTTPRTIAACWSLVNRNFSERIFLSGLDQRSAFMCAAAMVYAMVVTMLCVIAGDSTQSESVRWEEDSRPRRRRRRVVNGILQ